MCNWTITVSPAFIRSVSGGSTVVSRFLILDFRNLIQLLRLTSPLGLYHGWLAVIYNPYPFQDGFCWVQTWWFCTNLLCIHAAALIHSWELPSTTIALCCESLRRSLLEKFDLKRVSQTPHCLLLKEGKHKLYHFPALIFQQVHGVMLKRFFYFFFLLFKFPLFKSEISVSTNTHMQ